MANLGITLPLRLGQHGYFEGTADPLIQVRTNLTNLLLTVKGERVMQPDFGCDLAGIIFNTSADDGQAECDASIRSAVKIWMPFLRIDDVVLVRSQLDEHKYSLGVGYTLLTSNISDRISLVF